MNQVPTRTIAMHWNRDNCAQVRTLWACGHGCNAAGNAALVVANVLTCYSCTPVSSCYPAVGVTLNCEKVVKMLTALQRRQQARAGVLGAPGAHASGTTGLLLEGGGRQPSSQCDVLVCARGGDGRLQVSAAAVKGGLVLLSM